MDVGLQIDSAAYLFSTFAAFKTATCWVPDDDRFMAVAAAHLSRTPLGTQRRYRDIAVVVREAWGLKNGLRTYTTWALSTLAEEVVCFKRKKGTFKATCDQLAAAKLQIPLSLIYSAALANFSIRQSKDLPKELFNLPPSGPIELAPLITRGLADCHVHLGAAVPYPVLFLLTLDGIRDIVRERESVPWGTSGDYAFRPDVLLLASKWIIHLLFLFVTKRREGQSFETFLRQLKSLSTSVREKVCDATIWKIICADAERTNEHVQLRPQDLGSFQSDIEQTTLRALLQDTYESNDVLCLSHRWMVELIRYHLEHPKDYVFATHLTQCLRCFSLIHTWVTPYCRGGLDEFGRHFGRHKRLRREAGIVNEDLVGYGLRFLNADGCLQKLALRISLQPESSRSVIRRSHVAAECGALLEAYAKEIASAGRTAVPEIILPITLVRRQDAAVQHRLDDYRNASKWQFGHIWKTVLAISDFFNTCSEAKHFFGVLDVAGNEHEMANWIFFHLFRELEARLTRGSTDRNTRGKGGGTLSYTFHVGESYEYPLQGLRAIADQFTMTPASSWLFSRRLPAIPVSLIFFANAESSLPDKPLAALICLA